MKKIYQYIVPLLFLFLCFESNSQSLNRNKTNSDSSRPIESYIAYYEFNGNANDSTINGYNGTITGEVLSVADRFGNESSAYDFTNGEIQTGIEEQPDGFSLWFKSTVGGNLITWGENDNFIYPYGYDISITEQGVTFRYASGDGVNAPSGLSINLQQTGLLNGQWRHLVMDIDEFNGFVNFYIDGVFIGDGAISSNGITWDAILTESPGMLIGSSFSGQIDQLQVHLGQIDGYGILARYYQFGWPFIENTLIASYDFSGDLFDISGNDFDAINFGATLTNDRFGIANAAFSFDGVDDRIEASPVPVFESVTLSAWFNTSANFSAGFIPIINIFGAGAISIGANNNLEASLLLGVILLS